MIVDDSAVKQGVGISIFFVFEKVNVIRIFRVCIMGRHGCNNTALEHHKSGRNVPNLRQVLVDLNMPGQIIHIELQQTVLYGITIG